MKIIVYTPQTIVINDADLPGLTTAARKRRRIPESKDVPVRHIIEEARRAGKIELGKDYVIDLDAAQATRSNGARGKVAGTKNKATGKSQGVVKGSRAHAHAG
jgi:hypothetical protein